MIGRGSLRLRGRELHWGERTYVMGIVNVTPDSFSGDGLLTAAGEPVAAAVAQARAMVADGADLLDIGGESTRPAHETIDETEELRRVIPVISSIREALPDVPMSIDTTKPAVAEAALAAGADLLNDIWGGTERGALAGIAAERGTPIILMHNRQRPVYRAVVAEVVDDLRAAVERAIGRGVRREHVIVDPGIGFGKSADQNVEVLRDLRTLTGLGAPLVLGTSRKSTLGRLLDLPVDQRLEATLATTALGIAAGVDIVRVHDVAANVRAARTADAVVRGWRPEGWTDVAPSRRAGGGGR